ncbi:UDP-glucose--hexose-1-phosphate uridylyltransferase [Marinicrinis lubricantis]|uniref:Galactose-1-phosphate uridylyltransferase n=1 Tax=Marinicrinis lubricantis TaxID=2086470 RepID=A0ABW1IVP8_9BACL
MNDRQKTMHPSEAIEHLVQFALSKNMIEAFDVSYSRNLLLDLFGLDAPYDAEVQVDANAQVSELLEPLLDYAAEIGLLEHNTVTERDLLDARIMGVLMPRPSEISRRFFAAEQEQGIQQATQDFYDLCIYSNYIRMDRIQKNLYWNYASPYGDLEITINLSKPEKDPKEIERLKQIKSSGYPKCLLCVENVGYAGRLDHPARQNHRVLPMQLNGEDWYFQYSPYLYYNEHSIILRGDHVPMKLTKDTFQRLLDFVDRFPHYFIGSNADLPIVGGSILSHDHFQAGRHRFPIEQAEVRGSYRHNAYPELELRVVRWPMTVIRLIGAKEQVLSAANDLFERWKSHSSPEHDIFAFSEVDGEKVPHNTVTPIVRRNGENYEMDLVLRNNRRSEEHPEGIFHPHRPLHHIKKENIGLIEVMGLAILPGRLKDEMEQITSLLTGESRLDDSISSDSSHPLFKHAAWIEEMLERANGIDRASAEQLLQEEIGRKFTNVLEDAGVFKLDEAGNEGLHQFIAGCGWTLQ